MKKSNLFIAILLILNPAFLILNCSAQYTTLADFSIAKGANPAGALISDGAFLYGMTETGGANYMGTLFKIKRDGTGYSKLLDFAGTSNGCYPHGALYFDGLNFLYGTASRGGAEGKGIIFKIKRDGTGYSTLYDFGDINGSYPFGALYSFGAFLYGTTSEGGINKMGVVFKIKPDGTEYSKLLDFSGAANGRAPEGSLISDGTFLYGMTEGGGANDLGTIFKIKPDGTAFIKLLDFAGKINGSHPFGSLFYNGVSLFGMCFKGGLNDAGTVFKISTDGKWYTKLLDFDVTNGCNPWGPLISDGNFLYGITANGGINKHGVLFKIKFDGTGYSDLIDFTDKKGKNPAGSVFMTEPFYTE